MDGLNPECEIFGFPTAYGGGGPIEGLAANRLAPILHVGTMADGAWHHCKITYNGGTINVYLNGSAVPTMTGTYPITTAGYFGFSAGSGDCDSKQSIKEVFITSNTISPIVGVTTLCQGSTTTLSDSTAGGTWSSGNTAVATVAGGVVSGAGLGTASISYSYNSGACVTTTTVNVVPPVGTISGISHVCAGSATTLTDATTGGTWSSSNTTKATVGSTGIVTGVAAGTATITYSTGGTCFATLLVTVNSIPTAISGPLSVCTGVTTTLSDGAGGGTWSSSNTAIASIGSSTSGIVTGIAPAARQQ